MKQFIAIALVFSVIAISAPTVFAPRAQAILGVGDIVIDPAMIAQSAWQFVQDQILPTLLSALKQRLINTMTDEIIAWINGGGSPKFIQNFGREVFQPALNQAVGDTAAQILPSLCSPYAFKVNLELTAPAPQQQPSACTLNQIVANFNDFRQNFTVGGTIGYTELLAPQNNQYGVDIMTQDALYNNVQQQTQQSVLQTQVNVGFNSQSCADWKLVENATNAPVGGGQTVSDQRFQDPSQPPPTLPPTGNPTAYLDVGNVQAGIDPNTVHWVCADVQIATPGRALATGLEKSLYANIDLAISDPSIANALAMIADAAFNRLIKAGVQGLQGITLSSTNGNQPSTGNGAPTIDQIINNTSTGEAAVNYDSGRNAVIQNQYLSQLGQASSSLADAASALATASTTNQDLVNTLNALASCATGTPPSADYGWSRDALATAVSSTAPAIAQASGQVASSTIELAVLAAQIDVPNITSSTLNGVDAAEINSLTTNATTLDTNAQTTLSNIQTTLSTAQTKLTQCQASK